MPETNLDDEKGESTKKGIINKLKDVSHDKEDQIEILSTFVRLGILGWSGAILTLAYVDLPEAFKMPKQDLDPTFIASVFTGVLATFGVQTSKKNGNGNGGGGSVSKEDLEKLIDAAAQTAPAQTIRVEQGPIRIANGEPPIKAVPINPPEPPYNK